MRAFLLLLLCGVAHAHPHGELHQAGYLEETLFWWTPGPEAREVLSGLVADLSEAKGCPGRFVVGGDPSLIAGFLDHRQLRDRKGEPLPRARSMILHAAVQDVHREERVFVVLDALSTHPAGPEERQADLIVTHREETLARGTKEDIEATAIADEGRTRIRITATWFEHEVAARSAHPESMWFRERHRQMLPMRIQASRDPGHALTMDLNAIRETLPSRGNVQVDHSDQRLQVVFNDPGNQLDEVTQIRLDHAVYRIDDLGCGP